MPAHTPYPLLVLVVDDSPDQVETEVDLLSIQGHRVRVALNGEDALRCVDAERPDVVLLDIRLPGLTGLDVARLIRERCAGRGKQPIIVAVTGYGSDTDRVLSAAAGFDLHLVKPVDPALLVGLLERFRRLLSPTTPARELAPPPGDLPDDRFGAAPLGLVSLRDVLR
jgi:two-component system, OmpR family, response regulator